MSRIKVMIIWGLYTGLMIMLAIIIAGYIDMSASDIAHAIGGGWSDMSLALAWLGVRIPELSGAIGGLAVMVITLWATRGVSREGVK